VPGGVVFDAGSSDGTLSSKLVIIGEGDQGVLSEVDENNRGLITVGDPNTVLRVHYVNAGGVEKRISRDEMKQFQSGLTMLTSLSAVDNALSRGNQAFVGQSLSDVSKGRPRTRPQPIGSPIEPSDEALIRGLARQGMDMDDLQGSDSIIGRFFEELNLSEIGESINDPEALRDALDNLDDIPDNVTLTEGEGVIHIDLAMVRKFAGEGDIDVEAFDGMLTLHGEIVYSIVYFHSVLIPQMLIFENFHVVSPLEGHDIQELFIDDPWEGAIDTPPEKGCCADQVVEWILILFLSVYIWHLK